jgi:hypothetical protein
LRRHRKGVADDAGEPFVEVVLVRRLFGLDDLGGGFAGHELGAAALGEIASKFRVPVILKLLDLIRRPRRGHPDQRIGDRAFAEIIELPELATQLDRRSDFRRP